VPSCNSYFRAGQPSSANIAYQKATRRIRKPKRAVHRSLAAYGLYSTDCGLARRARWPVRIIRKWIAGGHIRPVLYKGKLYYSLKRFRVFVATLFQKWPATKGFLEKSYGSRLEYDPLKKILRKVGPLPS
jgi:hypothetical protein